MWIKSLEIKNFRAFEEPLTINFAKNITCISGHNAVGKSTILAILSNCGELKPSEGTHLNGSNFRGEFADIIKSDPKFDTTGEKATIKFSAVPRSQDNRIFVKELTFRTARQNGKTKERFRLLPKIIKDVRETEAKLSWPTYYLGLSRLYPLGESSDIKPGNSIDINVQKKILEIHSKIMGTNYDETTTAKQVKIHEGGRKKFGIITSKFGEASNSAGQDNIGQIILTVLSFEELKKLQGDSYIGGLLLIDEIDATLHPAVLKKLYDYLLEQSKKLDLQIVFTTHSLTLLNHVDSSHSVNGDEVKIGYLRRRGNRIKINENPNRSVFEQDLNDTYQVLDPVPKKVKVFTEDKTARWFIDELIFLSGKSPTFALLEYIEIDISWTHIVKLMTSDLDVYKDYIAILDPDVNSEKDLGTLERLTIDQPITINDYESNVLILPSDGGCYNIERTLWEYLSSLDENHILFDDPKIDRWNWHKQLIIRDGPLSDKYKEISKDNNKYKHWFDVNKSKLQVVLRYWINDNKILVDEFFGKLESTYKSISNRID